MSTRNNTMVLKSHVQTKTNYIVNDDGTKTFGDPLALAENLINDQGNNDKNLKKTCGICAVANVLRLAGFVVTEQQVLDYYLEERKFPKRLFWRTITSSSAFQNIGGSDSKDRKYLLKHFGVNSLLVSSVSKKDSYEKQKEIIDRIAEYVEQGKGVIVAFESDIYDRDKFGTPESDYSVTTHAVVVTSVIKDASDKTIGLYVHDSTGISESKKYQNSVANKGTKLMSIEQFVTALSDHKINVTQEAIR